MAERYGRDLRGGAFTAFVIIFPMFLIMTILVAITIMIMAVLVVVLNVNGMAMVIIAEG